MNRLLVSAALAVLLLAAPAAAAAAAPPEITVTAQGRSSTMPDMATVSLAISTFASSADRALSDNNTRYNRLVQALTGVGIAKSDVQTSSFNLNYNPPPEPPQKPSPDQRYGYTVQRWLTISVHRLPLVGKAVDAAAGAGVTDVGSVNFTASDSAGQYAQALRNAVAHAYERAKVIAAASGLHALHVKSISEGGANVLVSPRMTADVYRAGPAVPTQIEPSAVETTATVTVTYEAQ